MTELNGIVCQLCEGFVPCDTYGEGNCESCGQRYEYDEALTISLTENQNKILRASAIMVRTLSDYELSRRTKMVEAERAIVNAMTGDTLTAMEWVSVLHDCSARMISRGLIEEWKEKEDE